MALPLERQSAILKTLEQRGAMKTTEIASTLGVSIATVRRDLDDLEQRELIARSHGGALLRSGHLAHEPPFAQKSSRMRSEKEQIASLVSQHIPDGATIIVDAGTTTLAVAQRLAGRRLTAIALDLPAAQALAVGQTEVLMPGGRVRTERYSLMGPWAEEKIRELRAEIFIMGAHAIDKDGVTNAVVEEAAVKQLAMRAALKTFLVADHSKFGARGLVQVCALREIATLFTDAKAHELLWLKEHFQRIEFAPR